MDWDKAIERNAAALLGIIGALVSLLVSARLDGSGLNVPRHVWRAVLLVLRPAEAAVRRLVIIAARALSCVSSTSVERMRNLSPTSVQHGTNRFSSAPVFHLIEPLKRFHCEDEGDLGGAAGFGSDDFDDKPVNAVPLHTRLRAVLHALADLPAQAQRLARFNARREALLKAGRPVRLSLVRPGLPPGWRERGRHEVDTVLNECHRLVRYFEDTS